jgi:hypothetical protein
MLFESFSTVKMLKRSEKDAYDDEDGHEAKEDIRSEGTIGLNADSPQESRKEHRCCCHHGNEEERGS